MKPSYKLFTTRDVAGVVTKDGQTISGAGNYYSQVMAPDAMAQLGFDLESTGTLAGTFTFWTTNKENPDLSNDNDWKQDTSVIFTNPAGAATKQSLSFSNIRARRARVKFAYSGGAGDLKGYAN